MDETIVQFPTEKRTREVANLQKTLFDLLNRYTYADRNAVAPLIIRYLALLVQHPEVKANPLLHLGYLELELHWQLRIARETKLTVEAMQLARRAAKPSALVCQHGRRKVAPDRP